MKKGHEIAEELGYQYSVVFGSETYYPRMGCVEAEEFGIEPPFDVPGENFMACRFSETASDLSGMIKYAKEFGI